MELYHWLVLIIELCQSVGSALGFCRWPLQWFRNCAGVDQDVCCNCIESLGVFRTVHGLSLGSSFTPGH